MCRCQFREQSLSHLPLYPSHQQFYDTPLLVRCKLPSLRYTIPLLEASPAAACAGMLGLEYRMPLHWSLLTVMGNDGGSEARVHEVEGVSLDGLHSLLGDISPVLVREMESRTERRGREPKKCFLDCRHISCASDNMIHQNRQKEMRLHLPESLIFCLFVYEISMSYVTFPLPPTRQLCRNGHPSSC